MAKYKNSTGTNLEHQYKIGITDDLNDLMKKFATNSTSEMELVWNCECNRYRPVRTAVHQYYNDDKLSGEWFIFGPNKIASVIEVMKKKQEEIDKKFNDNIEKMKLNKQEPIMNVIDKNNKVDIKINNKEMDNILNEKINIMKDKIQNEMVIIMNKKIMEMMNIIQDEMETNINKQFDILEDELFKI